MQRKIARFGLSDRIRTKDIDFFRDPLPKADVITMGMILHDWNLDNKMMLIPKAYEALPEGGAFIAVEALMARTRRDPAGSSRVAGPCGGAMTRSIEKNVCGSTSVRMIPC